LNQIAYLFDVQNVLRTCEVRKGLSLFCLQEEKEL